MRSFWEERAEEDAFFFVDNRLPYGSPDLKRFWAGGENDLDTLLSALGVEIPEGIVLEIGCGVGRLTRVIARRAQAVIALDISARMLELAREHNAELTNVDWVLGDGRSLAGIEDASADCCISHVVFQHIPDPRITLGYVTEIGRVLRPGGWSAFQVSNDPKIHQRPSLARRTRGRLRSLFGRAPRGQADASWLGSAVALADLRDAAQRGGMQVEQVRGEGTQFCLVLTRRAAAAA